MITTTISDFRKDIKKYLDNVLAKKVGPRLAILQSLAFRGKVKRSIHAAQILFTNIHDMGEGLCGQAEIVLGGTNRCMPNITGKNQ